MGILKRYLRHLRLVAYSGYPLPVTRVAICSCPIIFLPQLEVNAVDLPLRNGGGMARIRPLLLWRAVKISELTNPYSINKVIIALKLSNTAIETISEGFYCPHKKNSLQMTEFIHYKFIMFGIFFISFVGRFSRVGN